MPQQPPVTERMPPVLMKRELNLTDDMKEYWGFYLLAGSIVTVSSCAM